MDNATFDRMRAFLLGNPPSQDDGHPLQPPTNPALQLLSFNQPSERNRNPDHYTVDPPQSEDRESLAPSSHSKLSTDDLARSERSLRPDNKPNNLPNYVYQYGKSLPFLNKLGSIGSSSDLQKPAHSHREFSPADKENIGGLEVLQEISTNEATTPVKRKGVVRLNTGSDTKKGFFSPSTNGKAANSPQLRPIQSSRHNNGPSYVDEQKKFYQKIRSQARKDILKPGSKSRVSPSTRSLKSLTPRTDTGSLTNLFSAQGREFMRDRRSSAGNSRNGSMDFNNGSSAPSRFKADSSSKKQLIDALLKRDENFQKHETHKAVQQIINPLHQIQIQKPKQTPREDVVYEYEENEKFKSDISPIRPPKQSARTISNTRKNPLSQPLSQPQSSRQHTQTKSTSQKREIVKQKPQTTKNNVHTMASPRQRAQPQTEGHDIYKKEIHQLITTIKTEKDQITIELEKMAKQLKKYKSAYKQLKKEAQVKGKYSEKSPEVENEAESDELRLKANESVNDFPMLVENLDHADMTPKPSNSTSTTHSTKINSSPARLHESTNKTPRKSFKPDSNDLIDKVSDLNKDIDKVLNGLKPDTVVPSEGLLSYAPVVNYVLKSLRLDSKMFYPDSVKVPELDEKPRSKTIVKAQNEMIMHLVRRLQSEQNERLKTEEQTHQVLHSMEKSLKKLEDTKFMTRKKEPTTPTYETNLSMISSNNFN